MSIEGIDPHRSFLEFRVTLFGQADGESEFSSDVVNRPENTLPKCVALCVNVPRMMKHPSEAFELSLLERGHDIRTVQELLGHSDVSTTMVYTHVLNKGARGVRSPLDRIAGAAQP